MKYTSLRIWFKSLSSPWAITLVQQLNNKRLLVSNFDNYGEDGSSYRLDIRFKSKTFKYDKVCAFIEKSSWGKQVLHYELEGWDEPEEVQRGHDLGSKLALTYRKYSKLPEDPLTISFFLALLFSRWWTPIKFPYWMREYDEKKFKKAVDAVASKFSKPPPCTWTIMERVVHNFLNCLGIYDRGENLIWRRLNSWWWLTQIEFTARNSITFPGPVSAPSPPRRYLPFD